MPYHTMRYVTSAICLLLTLSGYAQNIPKGASKMEVATTYADSALYESMLVFLDQEKFVIDKSDPKRGSIITEYQPKGKGLLHIRLIVDIKDKVIAVRGQGSAMGLGYRVENEPLQYGTGRMPKKAFLYMDDIVRALSRRLPGSTYRYVAL